MECNVVAAFDNEGFKMLAIPLHKVFSVVIQMWKENQWSDNQYCLELDEF